MKKIICIILTAFMAFSVTANANNDAIEELISFNIIEGDPNGDLRLEDSITRGEAAKVITHLLGVEAVEQAETVFPDVPKEYWASGYISVIHISGIINGMPDGNFEPTAPVTNEQLIKMIVCALGYYQKAEQFGGYPFGYMQLALTNGLLKGVDVSGMSPATRGDAAIILHNALDAPLMRQTGFGSKAEFVIMDGKNGNALETLRTTFFDGPEA